MADDNVEACYLFVQLNLLLIILCGIFYCKFYVSLAVAYPRGLGVTGPALLLSSGGKIYCFFKHIIEVLKASSPSLKRTTRLG